MKWNLTSYLHELLLFNNLIILNKAVVRHSHLEDLIVYTDRGWQYQTPRYHMQ